MRAISANHIWKHAGRVHCRTQKYNAWEREVHTHIPNEVRRKLTSDIELTVEYYLKGKRSLDVDNLLKGLLDSITHAGVWEDDKQVVSLHAHKYVGADRDAIVIIISSTR